MLFLFLLVASVLSINLEDINIEDIDEAQLFNDLQNLLDSNNVDSNTLLEGKYSKRRSSSCNYR